MYTCVCVFVCLRLCVLVGTFLCTYIAVAVAERYVPASSEFHRNLKRSSLGNEICESFACWHLSGASCCDGCQMHLICNHGIVMTDFWACAARHCEFPSGVCSWCKVSKKCGLCKVLQLHLKRFQWKAPQDDMSCKSMQARCVAKSATAPKTPTLPSQEPTLPVTERAAGAAGTAGQGQSPTPEPPVKAWPGLHLLGPYCSCVAKDFSEFRVPRLREGLAAIHARAIPLLLAPLRASIDQGCLPHLRRCHQSRFSLLCHRGKCIMQLQSAYYQLRDCPAEQAAVKKGCSGQA